MRVDANPLPEHVGEGGNWHELKFSIRDTGIGIPDNKKDRLFKTFSQLDQSTTRLYGGTGLGLVISKRLVEAMGGEIVVESQAGQGSTFIFTIQACMTQSKENKIEERVSQITRGKSVLFFDHNRSFIQAIARILKHLGINVTSLANIDEVLNLLKDKTQIFDLLLLDCNPPSAEKVDQVNTLCQLASNIPIILFANQWHPIQTGQLFYQPTAIVNCPIKYADFLSTLQQILGGSPVEVPLKKVGDMDNHAVIGSRHPLRILLVEDNQVNQKVGLYLLERLGYRTALASSGREALNMLRQKIYDVVFMDVQMAEMDGLETTRIIRQEWESERQPRIIALTAAAMLGDKAQCFEAGMNDFISKPIRLPDLAKALLNSQPISAFNPEEVVISPALETPAIDYKQPVERVDRKVLEELLCTLGSQKTHIVQETIELFISESGDFIQILTQALTEHNLKKMQQMTHTLKSTAASVGALPLSNRCKLLDFDIRTLLASPGAPSFPVDRFDRDIEEIRNEFQNASLELVQISRELPEIAAKMSKQTLD